MFDCDFIFNKYEESNFFKYLKNRIRKETKYIKKNKKANFIDYYELNKRKEQIDNLIAKMKEIHTTYKPGTLLLIDIPEIYQIETIRKNNETTLTNNETNQLALTS